MGAKAEIRTERNAMVKVRTFGDSGEAVLITDHV